MAKTKTTVRCPRRGHAGRSVISKGPRTDGKGQLWRRYQCQSVAGVKHRFRVLVEETAQELVGPAASLCHEHSDGHVVLNGTYGKNTRRQAYRCTPPGELPHFFAQVLPRERVEAGSVHCDMCEEFVSVHKGSQVSSRHTKWSISAVVDALTELAQGTSYSRTGLNVWEKTKRAEEHLLTHDPYWTEPSDPFEASGSWRSLKGRNAWHVAADLVEQYSPLLYGHVIDQVQQRELQQRLTNDEVKAAGGVLSMPLTYVIDEIPVWVRRKGSGESSVAWTIHSVAEVVWRRGKNGGPQLRDNRLRLVRSLPGAATITTWQVVLDELGVVPDVIVSDFGGAIAGSLTAKYGGQGVLTIPSLYHFAEAMREMCERTPRYNDGEGRNRRPLPVIEKHLRGITRDNLVLMGAVGWSQWWDELEQIVHDLKAPSAPVSTRREFYETTIGDSIAVLVAQPFLPASNASIEIKNRSALKAMLRGRQQRYRNIARPNALFDLVVCQENGLFNNRQHVTSLIRNDNFRNAGWAVPGRSYIDTQPPNLTGAKNPPRYSSLLDTGLVPALLESRRG